MAEGLKISELQHLNDGFAGAVNRNATIPIAIESTNSNAKINASGIASYIDNRINFALDGYAESKDLEALEKRVSANESNINSNAAAIESLQRSIESETIRATNAESAIGARVDEIQSGKQDKLTAGSNIQINGNTISATDTVPNNATITLQKNGAAVGSFTTDQSSNANINFTLSKSDVELGNADNTSDANKPISTATQTALNEKQNTSEKGQANGYASLDSGSKVPLSQISDAILGQVLYGGNFAPGTAVATLSANAKTRLETASVTITLTNNTTATTGYAANEGIYYIATAAGTFASISFDAGDWLISTGATWAKVDNTDAVTGVKGDSESSYRIGNVNITKANIGLGNVDNIQQATKTEFNTHNDDFTRHITAAERTAWNAKQNALNRTVGGNDSATGTVTDTGGNLSVPIPVTTTAGASDSAQQAAGTNPLRTVIQKILNNLANLFSRLGTAETNISGKQDKFTGDYMKMMRGDGTQSEGFIEVKTQLYGYYDNLPAIPNSLHNPSYIISLSADKLNGVIITCNACENILSYLHIRRDSATAKFTNSTSWKTVDHTGVAGVTGSGSATITLQRKAGDISFTVNNVATATYASSAGSASGLTGTLGVANGGTGQTSMTNLLAALFASGNFATYTGNNMTMKCAKFGALVLWDLDIGSAAAGSTLTVLNINATKYLTITTMNLGLIRTNRFKWENNVLTYSGYREITGTYNSGNGFNANYSSREASGILILT